MNDEIKCHGGTTGGGVFKFGQPTWREPQIQREPYGETFRSCSYCGSIHPEDLITLLAGGATMHGADWKYGWPHKFYVENIPNPHAGKIVEMGSSSGGDINESSEGAVWKSTCGHADCKERLSSHGYWYVPYMKPAPATMTAKFYNAHLEDCDAVLFARLAQLLQRYTGIKWTREGGKLRYSAPSAGYQR